VRPEDEYESGYNNGYESGRSLGYDVGYDAACGAQRPIIESEVRKRIVREIKAQIIGAPVMVTPATFNQGRDAGLELAARIAAGES